MEFNDNNKIFPERRITIILAVILIVLVILIIGTLYFLKQKNLGETTLEPMPVQSNQQQDKASGVSDLIKLTSAPENNPDAQPNPDLTALTSMPSDDSENANTDAALTDKLSVPEK